MILKRFAPLLCIAAAACVSTQTPLIPVDPVPGTPAMPTTEVLISPESGLGYNITASQRAIMTEHVVAAPRDSVWRVLPGILDSLGIPIGTVESSRYLVGNRLFRLNGDLGGVALSGYLNCGTLAGVASVENAYLVSFTILTSLFNDSAGGTRFSTVVQASARDPFAQTHPQPCQSLGILERTIAQSAAKKLGAEMGSRHARVRDISDSTGIPRQVQSPQIGSYPSPSIPRMVAGGLLFGAVGVLAGRQLSSCPDCTDNAWALAPTIAGATVSIPLGVHLSNRRAGNVFTSYVAAMGVAMAAVAISGVTEDFETMLFVPPLQLLGSVLAERLSSRRAP